MMHKYGIFPFSFFYQFQIDTLLHYDDSVTASIRDILSGKKVSSDRGLRSVAKTRGDRQRMGK